jgi:hypothetical protein
MSIEMILRITLTGFVVFRLTQMFTIEDGPFGIFIRFRESLGRRAAIKSKYSFAWTIAEAFNCPHCLGIWISLLIWPLIFFPCIGGDVFLVVSAIAGIQSFLQRSNE